MNTERYLLIGPVSRDRIVRGNWTESRVGGAVYYYSRLLSHLGVDHTALVTLSEADKYLLGEFPSNTNIIPLYRDSTVEFENIYDNGDTSRRIQRSNFASNPIEIGDIETIAGEEWTAVLAGPLLPSDIPLETLEFLGKMHRLYTGLQGYLRYPAGEMVRLKFNKEIPRVLGAGNGAFLDINELRTVSSDIMGALGILSEHCAEVIVTCGPRGSLISHKGSLIRIMAVTAERELDPTGLGDTYMAAYVHMRRASDPEAAGNFASLMATRKLEGKI
ncbi:PfkB family carbohydrate kinase [Methanothermobacter sp.]|uniref:PfkB family carbohydrate kinase n=1 Tax=Methanothermobacter sp. TaxID=1884223 RepID=UPI002629219E|nr:PfkB family carbohydrate kinase [Methanothermobacter sp.]MDI9618382.1 PfkB family carbohydrate kinase [Methanothermobacter sp.]